MNFRFYVKKEQAKLKTKKIKKLLQSDLANSLVDMAQNMVGKNLDKFF